MTRTMRYTDNPERRFFSREDCERLSHQVMVMARGGGRTSIGIVSRWNANLNWSRNTISVMSDQRSTTVEVWRRVNGALGRAFTNQIDSASLQAAMETAEAIARANSARPPTVENTYPGNSPLTPFIWDDTTVQQSGMERGEMVGRIIERTSTEGIVSAGFLQTGVRTQATINSHERALRYAARSVVQLSTTMRDWKQKGSGWAGGSSYTWNRLDPMGIATRALEKCIQSRNPVAIEPGRYLTILEPQAIGQLLRGVFETTKLLRMKHEDSQSPRFWFDRRVQEQYGKKQILYDRSKIGQRVFDPKVTIRQLPMHPDLGTWPYRDYNDPYQDVIWVDKGVLMNLPARRDYVADQLNRSDGLMFNETIAMDGGESSLEEMIATTRRGLLVTRFSPGGAGVMFEAYTRDGLWLIENGKISKAIKNFRMLDSPLFIFNDVLMLGPAIPIFSPENPVVVPPVKVREVNFVSLADAV